VAKKARDRAILVGTSSCHWKLSQRWRANHIGTRRWKYQGQSTTCLLNHI